MRNRRTSSEAAGVRRGNKSPLDLRFSYRHGLGGFAAFWPVVLTGMVVLLATVAVLQYRWTNEASSANEIRMGTELESLMMKWQGDLYGEFSAICKAVQVGPDSGARDSWNNYMERYVAWNNALPHESLPYVNRNPDIVGEIYIWETAQRKKPRFFWLNLDTKKIEPSTPPPEFAALLARLQANSNSLSAALRAWQMQREPSDKSAEPGTASPSISAGSNATTGWQFDPNIPAIVYPIFHHGSDKSFSSASPVDWIVITFDVSVLQKRILPKLAARYFGGSGGLDYKIAVIRSGSSLSTLYSSDPGFGITQLGPSDAAMSIFGSAGEESSKSGSLLGKKSRLLRNTGWDNPMGQVWFPVIQYDTRPTRWLLELQRRAGPLQAVVDGVRRNNLAISALVLLMLAVNVGILTFAGYRAQNFAKLQMDFVASISHELRTPLSAIFSAGENIKDGVVRKGSDMAHYGAMITEQSRRLMDHVDRILLFASIRSGKDRYTLRPLLVPEIFERVRKNMSALIEDESCIFEEKMEQVLPPVLGDMYAVCGCLENLITNAIKYSDDNRHIILAASLHNIGDSQEVSVTVEDHGMGIEKSELKHIFEPFYRSSHATTAQIHGTGLGLSLAKHLAEAVGGSLSVTSEIRQGSAFTLHLQLAAIADRELHTITSEAP